MAQERDLQETFDAVGKLAGSEGAEGSLLGWAQSLLEHLWFSEGMSVLAARGLIIAVVLLLGLGAYWLSRIILFQVVLRLIRKTSYKWDDMLLERRVFDRLAHFVPPIVVYKASTLAFFDLPEALGLIQVAASIYMVVIALLVASSFLNALQAIYNTYPVSRKIPIKGFLQVAKLALVLLGILWILSYVVGKPPWHLLTGLGAMTAVLLLIFRDAILGFVAGIQLTANNMVQTGDWISMPKYDADGDVVDVSLTTVKVQNWDKTITTIPTYALVSDSFKNWRGMSESGGRRIQRAVYIDMNTVRFCTPEMLKKFRRIQHISGYIDQKLEEIGAHNREHDVDDSVKVNGRRLTNIGTFRVYLQAYLRHHPKVNQEMTFLIRHLSPGENGLPVEVYIFSNDQVWANYEAIQADIFDHILAVIPEFGLRVFQNPSGYDFRMAFGESGRDIERTEAG